MKIKSVVIGNKDEAFIENRFSDGINIIYSDDNNRGKTIVFQGMMYALGNSPVFPESFDFNNYTYIVEIEVDKQIYNICRNKNSFIINHNGTVNVCDSETEFKYFFNKNIFKLPTIIKDNKVKMVDMELFLQIFFLGQDRKNTSNVINNGYYNKEDFIKMLFSFCNIDSNDFDNATVNDLKSEINKLNQERKIILKKNKIFKETNSSFNATNYVNDSNNLKTKLDQVDKINKIITELSKDRNRAINRKLINEQVLDEIESLNKSLSVGRLTCMECGATNIRYIASNSDFSFDISSKEIRVQIKESIKSRTNMYEEEITNLTNQIIYHQKELKSILKDDEIKTSDILLYKEEIIKSAEDDEYIKKVDDQISRLKMQQKTLKTSIAIDQSKSQELLLNIILDMNKIYKTIDPTGNIVFESLFSKKYSTYSGSEGTEYYFSRIMSLVQNLKHNFPIIIDHFRGGELSTTKEYTILQMLRQYSNQIILSATLKKQELDKYDNLNWINKIDYSFFQSNKLLQLTYLEKFKAMYKNLTKSDL